MTLTKRSALWKKLGEWALQSALSIHKAPQKPLSHWRTFGSNSSAVGSTACRAYLPFVPKRRYPMLHQREAKLVELQWRALSAHRSLVQETFGTLVSIISTRAVSFPRLFKRLVDTATNAHGSMGTPYTEFLTILTGMLESYRSDGDMLINHHKTSN